MWIYVYKFCPKFGKCRKYAFLGGPAILLRYYIGGVIEIYYNITMGGGPLGTPNLYYVIYGRPHSALLEDNNGNTE